MRSITFPSILTPQTELSLRPLNVSLAISTEGRFKGNSAERASTKMAKGIPSSQANLPKPLLCGCQKTANPPIGKQKDYPQLLLTVIHAQERDTPKDREKIDWEAAYRSACGLATGDRLMKRTYLLTLCTFAPLALAIFSTPASAQSTKQSPTHECVRHGWKLYRRRIVPRRRSSAPSRV
jgi:hypothetical protein